MVNGSFSFLYLCKLHKETTYFHNNQLSANLSDLMYFYLKLPTVLPIADAKKAEIKRYLIPATAKINSLYRKHPLDPSRYIAVSTFHDTIINEKKDEFCTLLKTIGAKYITFRNHPEWNKSYLSPDNTIVHNPHHGEQLEKNFKFFASSSAWQKAVHERLRTWCDLLSVDFTYDQTYNVTDSKMDVVYDKMGLTNKDKDDLLKKAGVTIPVGRTQANLDDNAVYQLFKPLNDVVEIQFFSKSDYKAANVKDLQKNWSMLHVQAFLRVIGMDNLSDIFREKKVDGKFLFKFTVPHTTATLLGISNADASMLCGFVSELGDLDHIDLLARVQTDLEEGDGGGYSSNFGGLEDKLAVDLGSFGTIDNFLEKQAGQSSTSAQRRGGYDDGYGEDEGWFGFGGGGDGYDGYLSNMYPDGSGCWNPFTMCDNCCAGGEGEYDDYDDYNYNYNDPEDFEWADEMDDTRSMTSAGARSAFTGASIRTEQRNNRNFPMQQDNRRKNRDISDNMSVASSSVSRPGASRRKQEKGRDRDRDRDKGGYGGSSSAGSRSGSRGNYSVPKGGDKRMVVGGGGAGWGEISIKTVLTGMPGVGKRRLLRRLGATEFAESKIAELTSTRMPPSELYDQWIVTHCESSGASLRHKMESNRDALLRNGTQAQVLLVVFDLTNLASFTSIASFIQQKVESATRIQWCSIVLVGNKLDLDKPPHGRVVTRRMAMELCQQFGIEFYVETSAKTAQNVLEILSLMKYHCKNERNTKKSGWW